MQAGFCRALILHGNLYLGVCLSASKQASKHYYLLTQVGLWQLFLAGVDNQSDILERISLGTHLPTPRGWTAELAGGCGKRFRRLGSNPGLPRTNPAP